MFRERAPHPRGVVSVSTTPSPRDTPLTRQIFRTKSIDKLISDSELPENALKKTLGPVSLTALGIGGGVGSVTQHRQRSN